MKCYWCGKIFPIGYKDLDHFIPHSLGGRISGNIVVSCFSCNRSKNNRIWIRQENGEVLKPKKRAKRFIKVIEHEKYFETIISLVSIVQKKSKFGRKYPLPKNHDYTDFGEEINLPPVER